MLAVKMVDGSEDTIEGLGIPFGGPFNGQDIEGEHFSIKTDFAFSWFPEDGRPGLYHHGLDKDAGVSPVGRVRGYEIKADLGVWTRMQLDKSSEYFGAIKDLVKAGKLFFSSGAMAHLVDIDSKSGEIKRWPWVELSLTPTPANLLATVDFATAKAHYKSAGLELPDEIKAVLDAAALAALPDSDFAYIDSEGKRHMPIPDAVHVRAAISRFNQTAFESEEARAKARRKIVARAKELDIEVSEDSMKAVSIDEMKTMVTELEMDLSPEEMQKMIEAFPDHDAAAMRKALAARKKMGKALTAVELVEFLLDNPALDYEPVPIASHADSVGIMAASLLERTKDLQQRRIKEGRVLSDANRKRLGAYLESLVATVADMQALLDSTAPQPAKAAAVRRLRAQLVAQQIQAMSIN